MKSIRFKEEMNQIRHLESMIKAWDKTTNNDQRAFLAAETSFVIKQLLERGLTTIEIETAEGETKTFDLNKGWFI